MNNEFEVIVVGGGFSGLAASYHLKKYGVSHIVFERGQIGESWRSQRWDSFRANSTNKLNVLPGEDWIEEAAAHAFATVPELVSSFERYAENHRLPVVEDSNVISVDSSGNLFHVAVFSNNTITNYQSRQVLIASGAANKIKIPEIAKNISEEVRQIHASEYRNAAMLPQGAVLVVGSAQSGCQIAEDLLDSGRKVYLSTSMVGRFPRWYRGRDILYWMIDTKFYDIKAEEVQDLQLLEARPPQISGTGTGRDSLSLQLLAKKGAIILGRMHSAEGHNVIFQPNAAAHVKYADEYSKKIKEMIEDFIRENNISAPAPHHDEADIPDTDAICASPLTSLDLRESNVNSIIWPTGFNADFSFIRLPAFDNEGKLIHKHGIPEFPGVYFLGYPWLRRRKSSILFGIVDDAQFIVDKMREHLKENSTSNLSLGSCN
ncbi:MAG TPA: NAD(P)/FAD-dependent oxidoreductase [Chitinophagaceae bacterium]|nr:NAD(P)/FAD-dependent oxidoreductase [Chitinophagaceae bacterium]